MSPRFPAGFRFPSTSDFVNIAEVVQKHLPLFGEQGDSENHGALAFQQNSEKVHPSYGTLYQACEKMLPPPPPPPPPPPKSHYEVLNVELTASVDEIRKAYKKLKVNPNSTPREGEKGRIPYLGSP